MASVSPLPSQRHLFEIPDRVVYLDAAGDALQLHAVRAAGERALARRAAPWTFTLEDWFAEAEDLRALFSMLIGADSDGVAFIPATSYGLAVAAHNTRASPADRVLLVAGDYPSNVHTWRAFARRTGAEILTVRAGAGGSWTEAIVRAIDERVRVVSVPHVHWTDGALIDLARVGQRAREVGAVFVVDATQSLGAMPLDVPAIRPDYLVAGGYKWLLGPVGFAYMFVAPERRSGRPLEESWINRTGAENLGCPGVSGDRYRPGARRFDVGQRASPSLAPMAIAALRQVLSWGVAGVAATLAVTTSRIEREARRRDLAPQPDHARGPHMLGLRLPESLRAGIERRLAADDVFIAMRGESMRVSPHLHTGPDDVDAFFAALDRALR